MSALTSASAVAYREQREDGSGRPSGKFRSLLLDVFGRSFPEEQFFEVNREEVIEYKERVRQGVGRMRGYLAELLSPPESAQQRAGPADMPCDG